MFIDNKMYIQDNDYSKGELKMNEIQNGVKNKKGDTVKVVLIIVLLILLIASMSFTVYDKFIKKDNTVNNQQTEEKDNIKNINK